MMRIYKEFTFEAGLFLPSGPAGDPNARLHGNSFVVRVTVEGEPDQETGLIVHFDELSARLAGLKDKLDHRLLNEVEGLEIPSLERMAGVDLARTGPGFAWACRSVTCRVQPAAKAAFIPARKRQVTERPMNPARSLPATPFTIPLGSTPAG